MGKKTPKAPDPAQTIAAQSAANKEAITESAKVNAVDQYSPWGSTTYQKDANGVPTSQTIALSPQGDRINQGQQNIAEGLVQKAGELANRIPTGPMDISKLPARQTSLDASGLPSLVSNVDVPELQRAVASRSGEVTNLRSQDYGAATKTTQDATFGKAQSLLQPGQQQQRQQLQQSLSDRGIPLDSAAGRAELTRMEQAQSEANNRSAYDAVAAGSAEQSRLFGLDATRTQINNSASGQRFGQDLQSGQFSNDASGQLFGMNMSNAQLNNSARAQGFNEALTTANFTNDQRGASLQEAMSLRNQDFNEASALLQGAPVMGTPQFMNTPTYGMQPVDAAGIYQQDYQNRVQAAQANNPWGGLFGLGSAAITKWSDRRLKRDVRQIATGPLGLALYVFRYVWGGPLVSGFMAQDVAKVRPEAVAEGIGGWLTINYRKLEIA